MIATNHALVGAIIGISIKKPELALPLAFVSHFVFDAVPHFGGVNMSPQDWLCSRVFKSMLIIDAILCFALVLFLGINQPNNWLLASVCAFLATSPDFMHMPRFLAANKNSSKPVKEGFLLKIHHKVQWFEKPIGAIVEVIFFAAAMIILFQLTIWK